MESEIKTLINKRGNRLTRQRQFILDYLHSVAYHPTAEQVYEAVGKQLPDIGVATVYRNLKYLVENGFALQISANDGKARYDGNSQYHFHFICRHCAGIFDIWQVSRKIAKDIAVLGKVEQVECNVYGVCQSCLVETGKRKPEAQN